MKCMLFAGLRTLLALQRTEEALFATEQGRAQGLTNLMLLHGLEVLLSGLTNSKENSLVHIKQCKYRGSISGT